MDNSIDFVETGCKFISKNPELSEWRCELFGSGSMGIIFTPHKGQEPNRFWRWMQYICFGNKWYKVCCTNGS